MKPYTIELGNNSLPRDAPSRSAKETTNNRNNLSNNSGRMNAPAGSVTYYLFERVHETYACNLKYINPIANLVHRSTEEIDKRRSGRCQVPMSSEMSVLNCKNV